MRGLVSYSLYVFCLCLALNGAHAQEPEIMIEDILDDSPEIVAEEQEAAVVHPDFEVSFFDIFCGLDVARCSVYFDNKLSGFDCHVL
ncbi:uncharacterized protein V1513DRAFT_435145 [Lipomyces chichibuensis]|uniref:uncharacterized protein n=1 Tax=Lipomyces chichibuensis TaxID=1546026 RepID=UPI0033437026